MAIKWCLCINATDGQWLFTKIVFWISVAIIALILVLFIKMNIQDCLERRRHAEHYHGRSRRNNSAEERFEEIRE